MAKNTHGRPGHGPLRPIKPVWQTTGRPLGTPPASDPPADDSDLLTGSTEDYLTRAVNGAAELDPKPALTLFARLDALDVDEWRRSTAWLAAQISGRDPDDTDPLWTASATDARDAIERMLVAAARHHGHPSDALFAYRAGLAGGEADRT